VGTTPKKVNLDELLKPRIGEGTVDIDGVGRFTIRAVTRAQALQVQKIGATGDISGSENLLISLGLVDPVMSPEQVATWAECAPAGELQAISVAIGTISGMHDTAGKDAYKSAGR
jgi:hypothetical protein